VILECSQGLFAVISHTMHSSFKYDSTLLGHIKTHGSELRGQEKCPHDDYRESIYVYQNVLKNGKQN